jgi:hypothetical protein
MEFVPQREPRLMTDMIERIITAENLRAAIRAKIGQGIPRAAISGLINAYADPLPGEGRDDRGVWRVPVEAIPFERRHEFLLALAQLQES